MAEGPGSFVPVTQGNHGRGTLARWFTGAIPGQMKSLLKGISVSWVAIQRRLTRTRV